MNPVMATMPSPPARFSTTTGWPHFFERASPTKRAVMSTPEPGPSETMNLTVRSGQAEAGAAAANSETAAKIAVMILRKRDLHYAILLLVGRFFTRAAARLQHGGRRCF